MDENVHYGAGRHNSMLADKEPTTGSFSRYKRKVRTVEDSG